MKKKIVWLSYKKRYSFFFNFNVQIKVARSKEQKHKWEEEYNKICKEIADAHGDHSESERSRRQHEAVENLKRVFTDRVYGRLVDLCKPSNRKYQLAVTKVLI